MDNFDPSLQVGVSLGKLYFGDNLDMLREHVASESVDLVYLDPPFNSKAQYNVLFKSPAGVAADAQLEAFQDSWHWGESAEAAFADVIQIGGSAARILTALRGWLGEADMMAYLAMMTVRLAELHRVLKSTGSLYLHCDPAASHYLKILLDAIFGSANFSNEIIWQRTTAHSSAKKYAPIHDTLLFYRKGKIGTWNPPRVGYSDEYLDKYYKFDDGDGRLYWRADVTGAGLREGDSGQPWRGRDPSSIKRHWALPEAVLASLAGPAAGAMTVKDKLELLDEKGRIYWPKGTGMPQFKRYREDLKGVAVGDIWTDINRINPVGRERLGYPTQKPLALMNRIIAASSQPGDLVLDPFCGCGTTVHAAEQLGRDWIGIDVTHHAVTVIEDRLSAHFPHLTVSVEGRPRDFASARDLARRDKYQFQWWANWLFGVDQYRERKKGADRGIDGERFFLNGPRGVGRIVTSVKGGEHVGVEAVRDLRGVLERESAELGVLVTLATHTRPMITEATSAGFVQTAHGRFPKIQLVAVGDLFDGKRPVLPVRAPFEQLKASLPRAKKKDDRQLTFTFALDGGQSTTGSGDVVVAGPRTVRGRAASGTGS